MMGHKCKYEMCKLLWFHISIIDIRKNHQKFYNFLTSVVM